ncbi:MAG: restriction endonuclease [Methanobacterium sp.]|nr:restriction endonuclease [Methanobacterium sp.]
MKKDRLIRFIGKVMEESGFKVYKNFKTSRYTIDIYGVLPTIVGDMGVVVACKNYDEHWKVGLDVLKEMEMIGKTLKASKIVVITTSTFTNSATNYAGRRNIKLIDKDGLLIIAKKFSKKENKLDEPVKTGENGLYEESETYIPKTKISKGPLIFNAGKRSLFKSRRESRKSQNIGMELDLGKFIQGLKRIVNNTIAMIIIVLLLSSFITYSIGLFNKNTALIGVSKILSSAILSYGLIFLVEKDPNVVLTKGTIVFFVSMIIYVVLILLVQ